MIISYLTRAALCAATLLSLAVPAVSQTNADEVSRLTLLPGWSRADGLYMAAIQIDLAPGWKTYWRAPGDAGIAPLFDWSRSDNLAQVGYFWPSPDIMDTEGVRVIGYEDQLILPILLRPEVEGRSMTMRLKMDYGVCEEICVPAHSDVALSVDVGAVHNQDVINTALARRSAPASSLGHVSSTCRLTPDGEDFVLSGTLKFDRDIPSHRVVVVETGTDLIWASPADHSVSGSQMAVEVDLQYYGTGAMTLDRSAVKFTLLNDGQSVEIVGCTG